MRVAIKRDLVMNIIKDDKYITLTSSNQIPSYKSSKGRRDEFCWQYIAAE
jgi:hypothetical protein